MRAMFPAGVTLSVEPDAHRVRPGGGDRVGRHPDVAGPVVVGGGRGGGDAGAQRGTGDVAGSAAVDVVVGPHCSPPRGRHGQGSLDRSPVAVDHDLGGDPRRRRRRGRGGGGGRPVARPLGTGPPSSQVGGHAAGERRRRCSTPVRRQALRYRHRQRREPARPGRPSSSLRHLHHHRRRSFRGRRAPNLVRSAAQHI